MRIPDNEELRPTEKDELEDVTEVDKLEAAVEATDEDEAVGIEEFVFYSPDFEGSCDSAASEEEDCAGTILSFSPPPPAPPRPPSK